MFAAPAKTPKEIVQRLNKEMIDSLKKESVISRIPGAAIVGSTPEAARELLAAETEKWKLVVRQANIQIQ